MRFNSRENSIEFALPNGSLRLTLSSRHQRATLPSAKLSQTMNYPSAARRGCALPVRLFIATAAFVFA